MVKSIDALIAEIEAARAGGQDEEATGRQNEVAAGGQGDGAAGAWRRFFSRSYLRPERLPYESSLEAPAARYLRLLQRYRELFPEHDGVALARAPGRVNLLGEHTDYNAGPVLPMALDRDILALFTPRRHAEVRIREAGGAYGAREFRIRREIPPYGQGDWGNYVKAAVQGLVKSYEGREGRAPTDWRGFDLLVEGTIPPAGGLSSSSALVVLAGLVLLYSNGLRMAPKELATEMAAAEYYVGTRGGGMDQAASLLGEAGSALHIDFADFSIRPVPMPRGVTLLVAHSLVPAAKSAAARAGYNLRAAECRVAAELLRRRLELSLDRPVQERAIGSLRRYLEEMRPPEREAVIGAALPEEVIDFGELSERYGFTPEELERDYYLNEGLLEAAGVRGLALRRRLLHVLEECERVEAISRCFAEGEVRRAGELMDASHRSCRDLFEISCRELDLLTEIERRGGALGARMTGAGFGGCTVALVPDEGLAALRERVIEEYYRGTLGARRRDYEHIVFPVKASSGASVVSPALGTTP